MNYLSQHLNSQISLAIYRDRDLSLESISKEIQKIQRLPQKKHKTIALYWTLIEQEQLRKHFRGVVVLTLPPTSSPDSESCDRRLLPLHNSLLEAGIILSDLTKSGVFYIATVAIETTNYHQRWRVVFSDGEEISADAGKLSPTILLEIAYRQELAKIDAIAKEKTGNE